MIKYCLMFFSLVIANCSSYIVKFNEYSVLLNKNAEITNSIILDLHVTEHEQKIRITRDKYQIFWTPELIYKIGTDIYFRLELPILSSNHHKIDINISDYKISLSDTSKLEIKNVTVLSNNSVILNLKPKDDGICELLIKEKSGNKIYSDTICIKGEIIYF